MRKFVTVALIVLLAVSAASCGSDQRRSNSAGNILPLESPLSPSSLEARSGGGGGGKGGGKGGGGTTSGGGSLSLVMVTDVGTIGTSHGDTITFNVSTAATNEPHVTLACYQNGSQVLSASAGFFDGYAWPWMRNMTLSTALWTSGAADCTAKLVYFSGSSDVLLATHSFHVDP